MAETIAGAIALSDCLPRVTVSRPSKTRFNRRAAKDRNVEGPYQPIRWNPWSGGTAVLSRY